MKPEAPVEKDMKQRLLAVTDREEYQENRDF